MNNPLLVILIAAGFGAVTLVNAALVFLCWQQYKAASDAAKTAEQQVGLAKDAEQASARHVGEVQTRLEEIRRASESLRTQLAPAESLNHEKRITLLRREKASTERDFDDVIRKLGEIVHESASEAWLPREEAAKLLNARVKAVYDTINEMDEPWRTSLGDEVNLRLRKSGLEPERRRKPIIQGLIELTQQLKSHACAELQKAIDEENE